MGRELQKKKNRSSISKVKQKPKSKKRLNPKGNAIIAANWYFILPPLIPSPIPSSNFQLSSYGPSHMWVPAI
jgi:hypothetical protein